MERNWREALADGLHRLPLPLHTMVPSTLRTDLRHRLGRFRPWEDGVDLTPPPARAGEVTGPPDFVGVAATLAGCHWWYRMIADHPGVTARPDLPPARHFLSHFATEPFGPAELEAYHRWFPRRPGTITGEWTPAYAALPWTGPLLARAAPDAKVLLLVRNPIDRLAQALARRTGEAGAQAGTEVAEAVERGCYGAQLARLRRQFPAEQVLVLQYERCLADPSGELARTDAFLGLDPARRPDLTRTPPGPDRGAVPLPPAVADRLVEVYAEDVARLAGRVPSLDLELWPPFGPG